MTVALERFTGRKVNWNAIYDPLDHLNRLATNDLAILWRNARDRPPEEAMFYMRDAIEDVMETYGVTAADLTADWWNGTLNDPDFLAKPVPKYEDWHYLRKKSNWAVRLIMVAESEPFARLALAAQQAIWGAQRETVITASKQTNMRYARYARADACAFCRVLASRGAVYGSKAAAKYVGMAGMKQHWTGRHNGVSHFRGYRMKQGRVRGTQAAGDKFHDHCRCAVGPADYGLDANLPDYYEKWEQQYWDAQDQAEKDNPGKVLTMSDITKAMRKLGTGY